MGYLEFIARVTSHIPDKSQVTVRYDGLYANAHRAKVRKPSASPLVLRLAEAQVRHIPSNGWAKMIRKVYEIDGGVMKVVAFITDDQAVDRMIDHLTSSSRSHSWRPRRGRTIFKNAWFPGSAEAYRL